MCTCTCTCTFIVLVYYFTCTLLTHVLYLHVRMYMCTVQIIDNLICTCWSGWQPSVSEELLRFVQSDNEVFSFEISQYDEKQKKILPAQHVRLVQCNWSEESEKSKSESVREKAGDREESEVGGRCM